MSNYSPNVVAYLSLIAFSEGTSTNRLTVCDGYDVIVSGPEGPEVFTDFSRYPFESRPPKIVNAAKGWISTASGRYQIIKRTWESYSQLLGLTNFEPASQDAIAVELLREVKALPLIEAGQIQPAIAACCRLWASFPGNDYDQGAHPMPVLMSQWTILRQAVTV